MKDIIPLIIAMSISGFIFMSISIKYKWSKTVWTALNKKINSNFNVAIWIVFSGIFNILLQLVCGILGIPLHKIILGVSLGFYLAFMPTI